MFSFAPNHREAQCYQLGREKPLRASSQSPATPASATSHHRHAVGAPGRTLGASGQSCTLYPAHLPGGLSGLPQSRPLPAFSDSKVDILPRTFPPNQSAWRRRLALWCLTYMQNRAVYVEGGASRDHKDETGTATPPCPVPTRQGPAEAEAMHHPELANMFVEKPKE